MGHFLAKAHECFFPDDLGSNLLNGLVGYGIFIVEGLSLASEVPYLPGCIRAVGAEHGQEGSHLKPAHIELAVALVFHSLIISPHPEPLRGRVVPAAAAAVSPLFAHREESAYVQSPVGISRKRHVEALRDLTSQRLP